MAQQIINVGTSANKGDGDPLRTAFTKVNDNFTDVYTKVTALDGVTIDAAGAINGSILKYNSSSSVWEVGIDIGGGGGGVNFTSLTDTPGNFTGDASKFLKVNSGETAIEFVTVNTDGIVEGSTNLYFTDVRADARIGLANLYDLINVDTPTVGDDGKILYYDNATTSFKWKTDTSTGILNVVEDTTPQLGGNLDLQSNLLNSSVNVDGNTTLGITSRNIEISNTNGPALVFKGPSGSNAQYLSNIRFHGDDVTNTGNYIEYATLSGLTRPTNAGATRGYGEVIFNIQDYDAGTNADVLKLKTAAVIMPNLPTSDVGLDVGQLWNDSGTVKVKQ
tara:strand:- start:58 stop:1059 length:1002 start_codon:yes stop_codon:yes gene_type:complete